MKFLSFLLLVLASSAQGAFFDCIFEIQKLPEVPSRLTYVCYLPQGSRTNITGDDSTIYEVSGAQRPGFQMTDVNAIRLIKDQVFTIMPGNMGTWFPNLFYIEWLDSALGNLIGKDLVRYPKLEYLIMPGNHLHTLDQTLFIEVPLIRHVDFSRNTINTIAKGVLDGLYDLTFFSLEANDCIDFVARSREDFPELLHYMTSGCGIAGECALRCSLEKEVDQLRERIEQQNEKIDALQSLMETRRIQPQN